MLELITVWQSDSQSRCVCTSPQVTRSKVKDNKDVIGFLKGTHTPHLRDVSSLYITLWQGRGCGCRQTNGQIKLLGPRSTDAQANTHHKELWSMSVSFWIQSVSLEKAKKVNKWTTHNQHASNSLPDFYSDMWYRHWIYFGLQVMEVYSLFKLRWSYLDKLVLSCFHEFNFQENNKWF